MHSRSFERGIKYVVDNIERDDKVKKFSEDVAEFIEHVISATSVTVVEKDKTEEELLKEAKHQGRMYIKGSNVRGSHETRRTIVQELIKSISGNEKPTKLSELNEEQLLKFIQKIQQRGKDD